MSETDPLQALDAAIARFDAVIDHTVVDRAIHHLFDVDLEQVDELERKLERAGYARTQRGDWVRW